MAGFQTKTFKLHDEYYTPKTAWEAIKHLLPEDAIIWEAFSMSSDRSATFLKELGFCVKYNQNDFFKCTPPTETNLIVSNPPFSMVKDIMPKLKELDMAFILIMPSSKLCTNYFREWRGKGLQIIIPRKRIQFDKDKDGVISTSNKCNFDCFYYCYKLGLEKDINWLS
jgi:hypothetical protein